MRENFNNKFKRIVAVFLLIATVIYFLPSSFAKPNHENTIIINSKNVNYLNEEAASWQITNSANWIKNDEIELSYKIDTTLKEEKNKDIIFVLDTSDSMKEDRLSVVKKSISKLSKNLLTNSDTKVALITFSQTARIIQFEFRFFTKKSSNSTQ